MGQRRRAGQYLVECFWSGVTEVDLVELDRRARRNADATRSTTDPVRYLGTLLLPGDEVVFCFFEADTPQAVRGVAVSAGIPFERVLESLPVGDTADSALPPIRSSPERTPPP